MNRLYAAAPVIASVIVLAGCGTDDGSVADDPAPTTASSSSPSRQPTAEPTVGTYPPFEPENYTFQLTVTCFCAGAGMPIEVTVEDAVVVSATHSDKGRGGTNEGDPADKLYWLTINDIIEAANDTGAARVDVVWPPGQDHPTSVYVDKDENVADEEIGYAISQVQLA